MNQQTSKKLVIPQLIVGLGNPESRYDGTRHNIGFEAVDALAKSWQVSWQENKRFQGMFATKTQTNGDKIYLLKPLTYMNRSGQSVRTVVDWFKLATDSVFVIYDEMDLPVGRLRMRLSGSAGGHNGIKSIISYLGGQNFPRLRVGIGKSQNKETISHVLGKFSPNEFKVINEILQLVVDAVDLSLTDGVEKSMSYYNSRSVNLENLSGEK